MAYDPKKLYTSAIRSPEDVPQEKTEFEMPSTRGGAPEWAQPTRQDVTTMIGRYPRPPVVPQLPAAAPAVTPRGGEGAVGAVAGGVRRRTDLLPNYLRNEQTGATYRFKSQPSAISGEYIPAAAFAEPRQSPAREALGEYEDILSTFGGTGAESALAADVLTRRILGRTPAIRQERGATERAAASEAGALERARLGEAGAMRRAEAGREPTEESVARAALLRGQLASMQDREAIEQKLADPKLTGPARERWMRLYEMKYGSKGEKSTAAADIYNKLVSAGMEESEARQRAGFADGGYIEGYANGGAIAAPITQTQQVNPAVAQYGQYLSAAASAGVPPVPFNQYMNLLQTTRGAMQETPSQFANGGAVEDETPGLAYKQPSSVDWGGVLSRGLKRLGVDGQEAPPPAAKPAVPPTVAGGGDEVYNPWVLTPEQEEAARARGYADGGDVSALRRPISGPGTGRSDSIPAMINGQQPAALSDGEFVIPAHVVKAKGTEFFEKLIGQYDQGQK